MSGGGGFGRGKDRDNTNRLSLLIRNIVHSATCVPGPAATRFLLAPH